MSLNHKGFTLIELLVVIFIIGILASLVIVNVNNSRKTARDAKRIANLKSIQGALEAYNEKNGSYPVSSTQGTQEVWVNTTGVRGNETTIPLGSGTVVRWASLCSNYDQSHVFTATNWVNGLVPDFISVLPQDPKTNPTTAGATQCYAYASNGTDYKIWADNSMETVCKDAQNRYNASASCNSTSIQEMADHGGITNQDWPYNQASVSISTAGAYYWSRQAK